jgi:hypothetical protein
MTVLLGQAGTGGQAGPAGSASAAKAAKAKAPKKVKAADTGQIEDPRTENHFIECQFTDSAGNPLAGVSYVITDPDDKEIIGVTGPEGRVRHDGYAQKGNFKVEVKAIANCKWGSNKAKPGESVSAKADIEGFEDNCEAVVQFFSIAENTQELVEEVTAPVKNKKIDVFWTFPTAEDHPVSKARFYVVVDNMVGVSEVLSVVDEAEIEITDEEGNPIEDMEYKLTFSDGSVRKGSASNKNDIKEKDVPPGSFKISS